VLVEEKAVTLSAEVELSGGRDDLFEVLSGIYYTYSENELAELGGCHFVELSLCM